MSDLIPYNPLAAKLVEANLLPTAYTSLNLDLLREFEQKPKTIGIEDLQISNALTQARNITIDALTLATDIATQVDPMGQYDELDQLDRELQDLDQQMQEIDDLLNL